MFRYMQGPLMPKNCTTGSFDLVLITFPLKSNQLPHALQTPLVRPTAHAVAVTLARCPGTTPMTGGWARVQVCAVACALPTATLEGSYDTVTAALAVAPCPANASNGPYCRCNTGYAGGLAFSNGSWSGVCSCVFCAVSQHMSTFMTRLPRTRRAMCCCSGRMPGVRHGGPCMPVQHGLPRQRDMEQHHRDLDEHMHAYGASLDH
jgi:hypothetical protein